MELTPVEGLPGVSLLSIPFTRTANGAVHQPDLAKLAERLMVWELVDLAMWYPEVNRFRSVAPPRAYSMPVAILPGIGKWLTVVCAENKPPLAIKTRPAEALLVPAGCYVGMQSLERNRTSYTVFTHRSCQVTSEADPADEPFLPLWEHSAMDPACNELTGKRLPHPA